MGKLAREVGGFVALPVHLPSAIEPQTTVQHFLYLRPHDPSIPDEDAPRSLFLVNVPVTATEGDLKHLLTTQLGGGRVENVHLAETVPGRTAIAAAAKASRSSRKRKRMAADEIESALPTYSLPEVWPSEVHCSGGSAVVVFVDRLSMELTLKAASKAARHGQQIKWRDGLAPSSNWGLQRYEQFDALRYPSQRELLRSVDSYMSAYAQLEEARSRENARKRQVPDEDGFVTVTRGSKGGVRAEEAQELAEKHKRQTKAAQDFYRFQLREKKKEQHDEMLKKFDGDKRKISDMRKRRINR
ncbi:hypothetical protein DV735_g2546, partial [Chaetothyriales sp. CBS 134920]